LKMKVTKKERVDDDLKRN